MDQKLLLYILIGIGAAILITLIVIIVLLVKNGKKRGNSIDTVKQTMNKISMTNSVASTEKNRNLWAEKDEEEEGVTQSVFDSATASRWGENADNDDDVTVGIEFNKFRNITPGENNSRKHHESNTNIVLESLENPNFRLSAPIDSVLTLGRKETDIVIQDDKYISRKHCEIVKNGNDFFIRDLGAGNKAKFNNIEISNANLIPIQSGGILEIGEGRYKLLIVSE